MFRLGKLLFRLILIGKLILLFVERKREDDGSRINVVLVTSVLDFTQQQENFIYSAHKRVTDR